MRLQSIFHNEFKGRVELVMNVIEPLAFNIHAKQRLQGAQ